MISNQRRDPVLHEPYDCLIGKDAFFDFYLPNLLSADTL